MSLQKLLRGAAALFLSLLLWPAGAAYLQVSPVSLTFTGQEGAQGLWLSNNGSQPLHAQARIFRWTQEQGADVLTPTTELALSPPMLAVPPEQRQILRVIRLDKTPPAQEAAYRVLLDELPPPQQAGMGVQFVLRYSLPVFVSPQSGDNAPALTWSLRGADKDMVLEARNSGGRHAQVSQVRVLPSGGQELVLSEGLYGYVLAHSTRSWKLEEHARSLLRGGRLTATINQEPVSVDLAPASTIP